MFITERFINKVLSAFTNLNYHERVNLDFKEFEHSAFETLIHTKELVDAKDALKMYQFCVKKWKRIEKLFYKNTNLLYKFKLRYDKTIETVSDEESYGTYYITNAINNKVKKITVASISFNEKVFEMEHKSGKFNAYSDGEYYLKYSKASSRKMTLKDNKDDEVLTSIKYDKNGNFILNNNKTKYELINYDHVLGIYDRGYIESLAENVLPDTNKMLADIDWDILDSKSEFGVAKLNVYGSDIDFEMLLYFACSTFLIFREYIVTERIKTTAFTSAISRFR